MFNLSVQLDVLKYLIIKNLR